MTDNAFNTDHDTELLTLLYTMVHVQKKKKHIITKNYYCDALKYCCTMIKITWYMVACPHLCML